MTAFTPAEVANREDSAPRRAWIARLAAGLPLAIGASCVGALAGVRQVALFLLGVALGVTLYHAAFGFTSAWRAFIVDRRGRGLRAQMAMLAVAVLLFFPALAGGTLFGQSIEGAVAPAGISVAVGAFLFGAGMQLGGGCGSGTLYTLGGGSPRMLITLTSFIAGSTFAASHLQFWAALPAAPPMSLITAWGVGPALVANLTVFAVVVYATRLLERRRHGALEAAASPHRHGLARVVRGPWPLIAGAVALALLNFATLALAGRPWGITSAFALWGSKLLAATGVADPARWLYWSGDAALRESVLADITSVMDFGVVAGALLAAALADRFAPTWRVSARSAAAAVLGGLLLGYGARLASGCNIGAFFSGIASGSPHGWLWIAAALPGNVLGTWLRPWFGLPLDRGSAEPS